MANDTIQANSSERIRALVTLSVPAIIFGVLSKRYVMCPSVIFSMRMLMLVFLISLMREISCDRPAVKSISKLEFSYQGAV